MTKKILSALLCATILLGVSACGSNPSGSKAATESSTASRHTQNGPSGTPSAAENSKVPEDVSSSPESTPSPETSAETEKALVVYFSMPETTKTDSLTDEEENSVVIIDGEVLGNTQYVAYVIQETIGADIFRIEPKTPYPTEHETLVDIAKEEQNQSARPALSANVEDLSLYDTIFVGYPNWWGDMPMILYSFFDENGFSGKTIIPFNTHGGSGFSATISTIANLEPNATVHQDGFSVSRNNVQDAVPDIAAWLGSMGY